MKFYRGSGRGARAYVEADHHRADDYYLAEGAGIAELIAVDGRTGDVTDRVQLGGDAYESWVEGVDVRTGLDKGALRQDEHALRFAEVVVNGPKSWSLAAGLHPDISQALDAAQDRAVTEIGRFLATTVCTRVGGRGEAAAGARAGDRDGRDPALHLTGWGPAPAPASAGERQGAGGGEVAGHRLGADAADATRDQRHRAPRRRRRTRSSGPRWPPTGTPSTRTGRSPSSCRWCRRCRNGPRRSPRTSNGTNGNGAPSTPGRNPAPGCCGRGTNGPGPTTGKRRRTTPPAARNARPGGSPNSATSGVDIDAHLAGEPVPVDGVRVGAVDRDDAAERAVKVLGAGGRGRSTWNVYDIRGVVEEVLTARNVIAPPEVFPNSRRTSPPAPWRSVCRCWTGRCRTTSGTSPPSR